MSKRIWDPCFTGEKGSVTRLENALRIDIKNPPLAVNSYAFTAKGEFESDEYIVLEYRAFGLIRAHELRQPFLTGLSGEEEAGLCILNDLQIDGKRHRLIAKAEKGRGFDGLRLSPEFPFFTLGDGFINHTGNWFYGDGIEQFGEGQAVVSEYPAELRLAHQPLADVKVKEAAYGDAHDADDADTQVCDAELLDGYGT